MKCITITPVEVGGKEYPADKEIEVTERQYEKLKARGAVKEVEIDFKSPEVPAASIHVEPQEVVASDITSAELAPKQKRSGRFMSRRRKG